MRVAMAQNIASAMLLAIPVKPDMTAIDFGCGTGLISLALQSSFSQITGIDTSRGMVDVLNTKIKAADINNIEVLCLDITQSTPDIKADVIVSSMALHHVEDVSSLLKTFTAMLNPGGYLVLADLDTEPGTFHTDNTGIYHFGFDREWFTEQLLTLGYKNVVTKTAHTLERPDADGIMRSYTIFLISGCL
jgi:2-polyprenyl-3-methyl-5-hydroxy-6-metoxy-1,4-benzoquinol methylase